MKTILFLVLAVSFVQSARAQAVQAESQEPATLGKPKQLELLVPARTKTASEVLRTPVTYSGFLVELARTNNLRRLLSLRKPADPKRDLENLLYEPVSGRAMGFRLFSIDF